VSGIIGGLVAALMWGTSTAVASRSTRMIGTWQVLAYVMGIGLVLMAVLAPIADGQPQLSAGGAVWALASAFAAVAGLGLAYASLRLGAVGVVAPITSCEGALAAVYSVIFLNERPSAAVGVALAVVAGGVVMVTLHARRSDVQLRPVLLAGLAAAVFGFGLVASSQAGGELGAFWTILMTRVVGVGLVSLPLIASGRLARPGRAWPLVLYSGVAEVTGYVGYVVGSRHGVAVPAVLSSQFAAVAVVFSFLVYGERLTRIQVAGVFTIGAGVAAVAVLRS
jgi:drug/metabolite transporter (DMT)-like permease